MLERPSSRMPVHQEKLGAPLLWGKQGSHVFVSPESDLFSEEVADWVVRAVFGVMSIRGDLTFLVVTSHPQRMEGFVRCATVSLINEAAGRLLSTEWLEGHRWPHLRHRANWVPLDKWPLPNVWLGVRAENQPAADERIPVLLQTPARLRWVWAEPLQGPINLRYHFIIPRGNEFGECSVCHWGYTEEEYKELCDGDAPRSFANRARHGGRLYCPDCRPRLSLVIVGGKSDPGASPRHSDWAGALRDQCHAARVCFWDWGAHAAAEGGRVCRL